jgi:hypothetical protein
MLRGLRKHVRPLAATMVVLASTAGCGATADRESGAGRQVDRYEDATDITVWRSADDVPNVVTFCADGLRFVATLSVDGTRAPALLRVPEQDDRCRG